MNYDLKDLHAVITGASGGLGLAMARALLINGATVAIAARPGDKLNNTVNDLQNEGLKVFALPMDVKSERSIHEAVAWVEKYWGKIDFLVNNAGLGMGKVNPNFVAEPKFFFEVDPDSFRDVIDTNLTGYFLVARGFIPLMIAQGKGRIVNISTSYSTMKSKYMSPYGPSRAGSEALSNIMSEELKTFGISVNVLLPGGAADTGLFTEVARTDFKKLHNLLSADIMVEPILFLASEMAEGLSGERIIATEFHEWLKINNFSK